MHIQPIFAINGEMAQITNKNKNAKSAYFLGIFKAQKDWASFTASQQRFIEEFFNGRNIFLTGVGGSGKSYVAKKLFEFLDSVGYVYGKTSTTGVSAVNIGGTTINSWAGIGLANEGIESILMKVDNNSKAKNRIKACKTLFIDEISMAKAELLDIIDIVCQYIRNDGDPFGGIQVVFIGDLLQLPPVFKGFEQQRFAFDSDAWKSANVITVNLTEVMRQTNMKFIEFLNAIREGKPYDEEIISECKNRTFPDDGIEALKILCTNDEVATGNANKLRSLPGQSMMYTAIDSGPTNWLDFIEKNCIAQKTLELKVGAQVMLIWNLNVSAGLANGALGKVVAMYPNAVEVKFANGITEMIEPQSWEIAERELVGGKMMKKVIASRRQIPLKLAYYCTAHKTQSLTLDRIEIDMSRAFAEGQIYVALSRVRSPEGLRIVGFDKSKIKVNKRIIDFYLDETAKMNAETKTETFIS